MYAKSQQKHQNAGPTRMLITYFALYIQLTNFKSSYQCAKR